MPCFIFYLRVISKYKLLGAHIPRGQFNGGFLRYEFGGLIIGGAYFRNFTVVKPQPERDKDNERVESCSGVTGNR